MEYDRERLERTGTLTTVKCSSYLKLDKCQFKMRASQGRGGRAVEDNINVTFFTEFKTWIIGPTNSQIHNL